MEIILKIIRYLSNSDLLDLAIQIIDEKESRYSKPFISEKDKKNFQIS